MLRILMPVLLLVAPARLPAGAAPAPRPATILVYLATPTMLLVWHASGPDRLRLDSVLVTRDSLAALVARLRSAIAPTEDLETCRTAARRGDADVEARTLAALLLPDPVRRAIAPATEVVIVPQGALQLVPFAVLPFDSARTPFGIRNPLRYAPSLAALAEAERRPAQPRTGPAGWPAAVIVGDPRMPRIAACGGAFRPEQLPEARASAQRLAASLRSTSLSDTAATKDAVRERLRGAPLVHLATHGYAYTSEGRARDSWIAFAPSATDDGLLTVAEIIERDTLTAELVVLAACQTGLGDAKHAEGVIGLQRAFLAKGARSVLVSLWTVSEGATVRLLDVFYREWLGAPDRPSKAEALRRAQQAVRADEAHAVWKSPEYWAGFVLVGAG